MCCVDVSVYPFPPPAGCEHEGVSLSTFPCLRKVVSPFHSQQYGCDGVSHFTANIVEVREYSCLYTVTTGSVDVRVQCVSIYKKHHQCRRAECIFAVSSGNVQWCIFVLRQQRRRAGYIPLLRKRHRHAGCILLQIHAMF